MIGVCLEGDSVSRGESEPEPADPLIRAGESGRSRRHSIIFGGLASTWGCWSFVRSMVSLVPGMLSLTGPSTLLATVASWDTTFSIPLSEGVDGDAVIAAAAAAAACLRLSASFISFVMPPVGVVAVGLSLDTTEAGIGSSLLLGLVVLDALRSKEGGVGLTKGSLITEVKALPWVEKVLDKGLG